jgi:hypothetical protein
MLQQEQSPVTIFSQAHQFHKAGIPRRICRNCNSVEADALRTSRALYEFQSGEPVESKTYLCFVPSQEKRDFRGACQAGPMAVEKCQNVPFDKS